MVLLGSVEAIDADRIIDLVDCFADHAPLLLVAEHGALPDDYHRLTVGGIAT